MLVPEEAIRKEGWKMGKLDVGASRASLCDDGDFFSSTPSTRLWSILMLL